jgi:GT2 family glycosyltransferase
MTLPLSIIIPSYQQVDDLAACLRSVTAHAPPGTEVVVVDDASVGATVSRVALSFGVRVVRLPRRVGFCGAVNAGLRATSGEIVELLNDDTVVSPGWAEAILPHFDYAEIAAVTPLVLLPDGRIDTTGDEYDPGGFARKRGHGVPWADAPWRTAGPVWGVSGVAGFYRRTALDAVGFLPEDFGAYFEDVDLAHRLNTPGFTAWYEPASVVTHHLSSSYGRTPSRRTLERQSCNEERVFWRNTTSFSRHLPRHLAVLFGKALRRQSEGTLTPWLTGRLRGLFADAPLRKLWG